MPSSVTYRAAGVLYIIAKAPRAGESKTRLCPPLDPAGAALLAGAFLRDTIALATRAGVDVRLIGRTGDERTALLPYAGEGIPAHVQSGHGLGAAMESAFRQGFADGYPLAGVLGADLPTLPPTIIAEAFDAVAGGADIALGPSDDGGYYLLVARQLYPSLFRDMVWSTSDVAAETLRRCRALHLTVHLTQVWDDVDDADALARLREFLAHAGASVAPHTHAALVQLFDALDVAPSVDVSVPSTEQLDGAVPVPPGPRSGARTGGRARRPRARLPVARPGGRLL